MPADSLTRGEETRAALVSAALAAFGDKGYDAASTREIASAAGANAAMIAYHFGGKEGLRAACADHIAGRVREIAAGPAALGAETPAAAAEALRGFLRALVRGLVADEAARPLARFLMRELADPSPAFERIYEAAFAPLHARLCRLWALAAGGDAESEETRLQVFASLASVVYFRIARAPILRRMGWADIGPQEAAAVETILLANLDAALARQGRDV